jgi:2-methylisocitrate lyase-like PEP mutase family enzyme
MSRLGWADLGLVTLNDMATNAEMIANLDPSVPLIADADTGYGGPVMCARTLAQYARAGVAALHIEDQVQEKRCGHLLGKEIVSRDVFFSRIRAAANERHKIQSDILIIARTDSRQGQGFDEAIGRLKGAVEAGADAVFLEALTTKEECRKTCEMMGDVPVLLNMVPKGVTPEMSVEEAKALGFRIMIFPGASIGAVLSGVQRSLESLKHTGTLKDEGEGGVRTAFNLCGLRECIEIDKLAGGKSLEGA